MANVLYLHGASLNITGEASEYDFVFRKVSADRFDKRYEVLKNRITGKTGYTILSDEIPELLEDK